MQVGRSAAAVLAVSLTACGSKAEEPAAADTKAEAAEETASADTTGEKKVLKVAMECGYAPYNWTQPDDSNGAVQISGSSDYAYGYDVMMAKKIADEIADVGSTFIAAKMVQDAPMIIQKGYADGEPVSPNIIKNTLIGAVLGAFLAMAIIVISYLFNDTIMTAEDVEKKLGLNVLGTLPLEEAEDDGEGHSGNKKGIRKKKSKKQAGDKA